MSQRRRVDEMGTPLSASEQILQLDAELREESSVPMGVDLGGELAICPICRVLVSTLTQQLEDPLLGYLHPGHVPGA